MRFASGRVRLRQPDDIGGGRARGCAFAAEKFQKIWANATTGCAYLFVCVGKSDVYLLKKVAGRGSPVMKKVYLCAP